MTHIPVYGHHHHCSHTNTHGPTSHGLTPHRQRPFLQQLSQTNVTADRTNMFSAHVFTLWTITRIIRRTVFGVPRKHHLCVHSLLSLTFTISLLLSSCLRPRSGFLCARRPVLICQTIPTKRDTFKSVQTCPRRFQMCLMRSPYRVEVKGRLEMGSVKLSRTNFRSYWKWKEMGRRWREKRENLTVFQILLR